MFVGLGNQGLRMVSDDGRRWEWVDAQPKKTGGGSRIQFYDVIWADNRFVGVGSLGYTGGADAISMTSEDGREWQSSQDLRDIGGHFYAVAYGNGFFLAMGGNGGHAGMTMGTSQNGWEWKLMEQYYRDYLPEKYRKSELQTKWHGINVRKLPKEAKAALKEFVDFDDARGHIRQIVYGNGRFVAIGDQQRNSVTLNNNALKWKTHQEKEELPPPLISIVYANGLFVAGGMHGERYWSEDGFTWSEPVKGEIGEHVNSIVWTGDRFVAVANYATFESADGKTWDKIATDNLVRRVSFGDGRYIGTNGPGDRVYWSTNAIEWHDAEVPDEKEFYIRTTTHGAVG